MEWRKEGLIYVPDGRLSWAKHSVLQPTPYLLEPSIIRVFGAFRDDADPGVGRIGYVDVDAYDPSCVIKVSEQPCLDVGIPGCFDDNGVVPCCVFLNPYGILYMWYSGHQLATRVRNLAFSGLAISHDNGKNFLRWSNTPWLERTSESYLWRAVHSVLQDGEDLRIWYCAGHEYIDGYGKQLPKYNIWETKTAIDLTPLPPGKGAVCFDYQGFEYRLGRPWVIYDEENAIYRMWFSYATPFRDYRIGYATSYDGTNWDRGEDPFDVSEGGWDSEMICFASVIKAHGSTYMFYNGNNHGETGFGLARLV
jgi:hypothetical protein